MKLNTDQSKSKRTRQRLVTPSSKDSISGWLDVLTSMLSLNEPQRSQVRDEMEDHLRSRVDDLLITGLSEPEAVRVAVSELGETAELAQLISNAHQRTTPRRRIMNTALIITAIAGMSFGGYSLTSGNSNNSNTTNHGLIAGAGAAGVVGIVNAEDQPRDEVTHSFDLKQKSMKELLTTIASAFDRTVEFSSDSRKNELGASLNVYFGNFDGEYSFSEAIQAFHGMFSEESYGYKLTVSDSVIRFESYDEFHRGQVVTQVHSSPSWMHSDQIGQYAHSLQSLLSVKHDLEFASIEVIGDAIVVAAPPNIQIEVVKMMHELDASMAQRQEEQTIQREMERKQAIAMREQRTQEARENFARVAAEFDRTVNSLQNELEVARASLLASKAKLRLIEDKMNSNPFSRDNEDWDPDQERAYVHEIRSAYDEAQLQLEEAQDRYSYLRSRLLDSQYAQLFKGLE